MRFAPGLVDGVIDAALAALAGRDRWRFEDTVTLLVGGPGGPGGHDVVDGALARRLEDALAGTWADGWQPSDLARVVARQLGATAGQVVSDAIVGGVWHSPPATVPARWRAQVDDLDGGGRGRSGGRRRSGEPGAGAGGREAREGRVRAALEGLALVTTLPPVPRLGPPPGQAGGQPGGGPAADSRILHRVRGLLAKAESTTFPDEAEALTAKAQELMARHAVDAAVLQAERGTRTQAQGRRLSVDDPYAGAKAMLVEAIASANRCRSVWSKGLGYATVFGDEGDLDAVELLYTSLLVQAARAMLSAGGGGGRAGGRRASRGYGGRTRAFRQSFLVAFASRIGARLREAVDAAAGASTRSRAEVLPVLADRRAAADAACQEAFPQVRATSLSANDWRGWQAGQRAAEAAQLDLHTPVARSAG